MRIKLFAALLATSLAHAHAAAPIKGPMAPAGPWNVDFADKLCALSRPYAVGDKKLTLGIKTELVGGSYEVMIFRGQRSPSSRDWSEAFFVKSGGAKVGPFHVQTYSTASQRISRFRVDPTKYKLTEDGDRLAIDVGKEGSFDLAVPMLGKALGVLEGCIKNLRKGYQIDQTLLDRVVIEPKKIEAIFKSSDYPFQALRIEAQGDVGALLWIGVDGRVADCIIVELSGVESLDAATCPLLQQRARYEAARDGQGNKMGAPVYYPFRWRLPDSLRRPT